MHPTALRRESASLDLELLQRIWKWERQVIAVIRIVMCDPIQNVPRGPADAAGDGHVRPAFDDPTVGGRCCCVNGRAGKNDQVRHFTPVQRQLQDSCVLDHLPDTCGPHFHQGCVGSNLDLIGHLANLKDEVDYCIAVHLQHDSGLNKRTKTLQTRLQAVRTGCQA